MILAFQANVPGSNPGGRTNLLVILKMEKMSVLNEIHRKNGG